MLDEVDRIGSVGHDREPAPPLVVQPAAQFSGGPLPSDGSGTQATSGTIRDALDVPAPAVSGPLTAAETDTLQPAETIDILPSPRHDDIHDDLSDIWPEKWMLGRTCHVQFWTLSMIT